MKTSKPLISFVVTARNDDYGGNWTNRINAFIKILAYQAGRTSLPCELVFVEYNPPADKTPIYDALALGEHPFLSVRFITVPNEFHARLPDHDKVTVCEFIGKNIGVRRAQADWIIATNPDVLYGDSLFDFFARGIQENKLDEKAFYRINRQDLSVNFIEPNLSEQDILALARTKRIKILFNNKTVYVSWKEWLDAMIHGRTWRLFLQCPAWNLWRTVDSDDSILHENAAGDFLMMHKSAWEKVRGYDQVTVGSGVLDGYIMYVLYCHGFSQQILPFELYHIYHHHKGVRYLASHIKFREDAKKMLATKIPYKTNSPDWGFPSENFKETVR